MDEVRLNPSRYVMLFRPSMLESDFGGILPDRSRCLYSRWTGYLKQPEWQMTKAKLEEASGDLIETHTSGHIFYDDIIDLVGQIKAEMVIPIHTFEPEKFETITPRLKLLADGESFHVC